MTLDARAAHIIAQSFDLRSALGLHTAALIRVLEANNCSVILDIQDRRDMPGQWRSLLAPTDPGTRAFSSVELTILEYPIWFPLAERFQEAGGAAVFWYHGVTPPDLWGDATEQDILRRSEAGTELAWYAHLAVADSPFIAEELQRHSAYPAEQIRVVPIGVDLAGLRQRPPEDDLAALRVRWGVNDRRVLLYVGRIAGNKRLDLLVEALALLGERHSDLHLIVVGDTDSLPAYHDLTVKLRAQATQRGVGDRVTFTGRVESLQPFYHLAEVCVLPSQHEGFGVPLVESMAAGLPVVAAASGAMPWVLNAGQHDSEPAGQIAVPGDAVDLAAQIAQLLDDTELRRTLVERGRRRAEFFGIKQFNARTRAVLAEASQLARQGPPPAARRPASRLYRQADVALREYRVRSSVPVLGPLIEWLRSNSTSHIKEAYLDRVVEQQVLFNRALVDEIERLRLEVHNLRDQLSELTRDR